MKQMIEERLHKLKEEFQLGQQALGDLEARQAGVRTMLARIARAIQVLEDLLQQQDRQAGPETRLTAVDQAREVPCPPVQA
jgi:prefoldin subunit 5